MSKELVVVSKPALPEKWDYDESVKIGKQLFIRWKDITIEMAEHFWIAREALRKKGGKPFHKAYSREITCVKTWGDYCQEVSSIKNKNIARDAFNRVLNRFFSRELPEHEDPAALPEDKFRVIYADPPWKYADKLVEGYGPAEHHYPTMSIEELCSLKIDELAAKDSVLFLWVTSPILDECFEVIKAWGFEYKTSFIWDKVKHNYGHYNSVRHEFLLICTKGSCLPENKKLFDSVISLERTAKHSEKPEKFRKMIDELYPSGKRIELFARKIIKGWERWGDETK